MTDARQALASPGELNPFGRTRSAEMMTALSMFGSPIRTTYLEQIAMRPAPINILRRRAWATPQHHRIIRSLEAASWILEVEGSWRLRHETAHLVREYISSLIMRSTYESRGWDQGEGAPSPESAHRSPIDARVGLARLSTARGWEVYEAITLGLDSNTEIARSLRVCHSLISFHVKHLALVGLVEPTSSHRIRAVDRGLLEIYSYFRLLEEGWPYRPGTAPSNTYALHTRSFLQLT